MGRTISRTKICASCGHKEEQVVPRIEAQFQSVSGWGNCIQCGSIVMGGAMESLKIDNEAMEMWIKDPSLVFLEQDEEFFIAGEESFEIIIEFIDRKDALLSKRVTLFSALCVNIYDNAKSEPNEINLKLYADSIREVEKRKDLFDTEAATIEIMPYIRKVVYPLIGLTY